jgi:hypothetical protein
MLVLSRKPGEQVVIGDGITLTVVEVRGGRVRLAFDAPDQVRIRRACKGGPPGRSRLEGLVFSNVCRQKPWSIGAD